MSISRPSNPPTATFPSPWPTHEEPISPLKLTARKVSDVSTPERMSQSLEGKPKDLKRKPDPKLLHAAKRSQRNETSSLSRSEEPNEFKNSPDSSPSSKKFRYENRNQSWAQSSQTDSNASSKKRKHSPERTPDSDDDAESLIEYLEGREEETNTASSAVRRLDFVKPNRWSDDSLMLYSSRPQEEEQYKDFLELDGLKYKDWTRPFGPGYYGKEPYVEWLRYHLTQSEEINLLHRQVPGRPFSSLKGPSFL